MQEAVCKRRVLIIHPAMAPYRIDLFNRLSCKCQLRVVFLNSLPPYDANLRADDLQAAMSCDFRVLAMGARPPIPRLASEMRNEVRRYAPDVVVTHEFNVASVAANALPILPRCVGRIIWTTRSESQFRQVSGCRRFAIKTLARQADALLAYSECAKRALVEVSGVLGKKVFVCANHQSGTRLRRLADEGKGSVAHKCEAFGLHGAKLIVTVGRLVESKNVETTIRAFAAVFKDEPDTALIVIGEGPLRKALEACSAATGLGSRIRFVGHVPAAETQAWLAAASLNVLASKEEPYGAVVAEGLAHGTPCICSVAAGASILIDSSASSRGSVFVPGSESELATKFRLWRPLFNPWNTLVAKQRSDLRPATVEDDVEGFLAAVSFAQSQRTL